MRELSYVCAVAGAVLVIVMAFVFGLLEDIKVICALLFAQCLISMAIYLVRLEQ